MRVVGILTCDGSHIGAVLRSAGDVAPGRLRPLLDIGPCPHVAGLEGRHGLGEI